MAKQWFRYYALTTPGVEEIAWLEIRLRLPGVKFGEYLFAKEQNGIVVFDYDGDVAAFRELETVETVFLQALSASKLSRGRRDLVQVRDLVTKAESVGQAGNQLMRLRQFSRPPSYRVVSRKFGQHEYQLKDVQKAVLEGMTARYPRWTPLVEGAQVEMHVELLGSQLLCGFLVMDKRAEQRQKLAQVGPEETRPSLAAALVMLTEPEPDDVFLDPLADNGRLLFMRRLFGSYGRLLGADLTQEALDVAQQNLSTRRRGSLPDDIELHLWEYDDLPFADESVNKVAVILPDGKQVGNEREMKTLYAGMFREIARVLRPDGRAVILSREYDQVKDNLRERPLLEIQTGYSVKVGAQWGRIYVIKRGGATGD